ncbi:MAG: RelA/SpoT family protein [Spirochaetaceae bacterium]|nr:RelA/SpoT family protein [Spirochaetaceae bacterium]
MSVPEAQGDSLTLATGELVRYQPDEAHRIRAAVELAAAAHDGQRRASGEPYLVHPLSVGRILIETQMDADAVCAGLLHDAIEDTRVSERELRDGFGPEVAELVQGVTKISQLRGQSRTVQKAETILKILLAMTRDVRVIIIKLADKLHNMRTLEFLDQERRKRIAEECLEIYSPLAGRLGMHRIKSQLEDEALRVLQPAVYEQLRQFVTQRRDDRHEYLLRIRDRLVERAAAGGLDLEVQSRAKHFYSIYRKQRDRGKAIDEIHDLFGMRVLCANQGQCYEVLGLIHSLWPPMEGRFKDYIAMPKSNGYQSLHTTVMGPEGRVVDVQIRTREMDRTADNGVAAHWVYKQRQRRSAEPSIIAKLREWDAPGDAPATPDPQTPAFFEQLKREILSDSIYVFTPRGDVIELPRGATPIDFAYHIHTEVGHRCRGAKADGAIVQLGSELRNTQVVEILTASNARPNLRWLQLARTSRARTKIRQWLTQNDPDLILDRAIVAKKSAAEEAAGSKPAPARRRTRTADTQILDPDKMAVRAGGFDDLMINFGRCCSPASGDPIVGYVSRGKGITVHRTDCRDLLAIRDLEERRIDVAWESTSPKETFNFRIVAGESAHLFSEIESGLRKIGGHLIAGKLEEGEEATRRGMFTVEVEPGTDRAAVIKNINAIPTVHRIEVA